MTTQRIRRYIRNSFLSPDVIDESIDLLHEMAQGEGQEIALAGGIAMQMYGSDRLTGNVDVIVERPLPGVSSEGPLMVVPGYKARLPNGVQVDVIVPEEGDEWSGLFAHARGAAVPLSEDGIPVVTPEYMVALKMLAHREDKDIGDLYFLLATPGVTDLPEARAIVRRELGKFAVRELDAMVDEARWAMSRRQP